MAKKIRVTSNLHQLHFEDLEPHRFEDLIRQLSYDFRDWQTIEATGRGGSDDGYDIRAWEKVKEVQNNEESEEEKSEQGTKMIDGNLWMIQCKREKEIGPTKVKNIINENVTEKSGIYGYILAAPVNFTKKSYDIFREELRGKGISEFYMWGRAELEDMLMLPKNDHTLFTFFGISLVVKKRSRISEVRYVVNNKNKLYRVLGGGNPTNEFNSSVLLRDYNDTKYPWKKDYKDFEKFPHWEEHIAFAFHPVGLLIHAREYYAYFDKDKMEFDFTREIDLITRTENRDDQEFRDKYFSKREKVEYFWKHLPRKNQAKLKMDGLLAYEDILLVDDKGDVIFNCPHLFVDFKYDNKPFKGHWNKLTTEHELVTLEGEKYKKVEIFPKVFPSIKRGKVHSIKTVKWDEETLRLFKTSSDLITCLYDINGKYDFLQPKDVISIEGSETEYEKEKRSIEITHKFTTTVKEYLILTNHELRYKSNIERQIGHEIKDEDKLNILEFDQVYSWQLKPSKKYNK